jgi:hypothetical protein
VDDLASDFDTAWKEALEWFFEPFLAFFFPTAHAGIDWSRGYEFLDKELQQLVPEATTGRETVDKLAKVWTPAGEEEWVLVHVEVQSQHDVGFARRMYVYNHRLRDKHGRMAVSLAVLGDESNTWRPSSFREGRWDCEVQFKFPMVKLVDYKGQDAELEANPNPFVAVVLAHRKAQETKSDYDKRFDWKIRLVRGLFNRGFNRVQIQRLFRVIDWVIKLPKAQKTRFNEELKVIRNDTQTPLFSPTQQDLFDEAKEEAIATGRAAGMAAGLATGLRKAIEKGLARRGAEGSALMPRVNAITELPDLEAFLDAVLAQADLDALRAMLPPQPQA